MEGHVMSEIFECFRNRREVPPQEPSAEYQLLEEMTTAAKKVGYEWAHSMAREEILKTLDGMHARGMGHRDRVDAVRMVRLLESLEPAKGRQRVAA